MQSYKLVSNNFEQVDLQVNSRNFYRNLNAGIDKFFGSFSIIYVFTSFGANDKYHQKSITIKNAEHTQTCFVLIAKLLELGVQQVAWGKEENAFENMLFRKAETRNDI